MSTIKTNLPTNTWAIATWDEFIEMANNPAYKKAKCYYHNEQIRIETMPIGPDHSRNNAIILFAINLFCTIKGLAFNSLDNCSYRMTGIRECQPDISYYIGKRADLAPKGTAITNLDTTPPPDLVIEVADSTLADDIGHKRLLYEEIQVAEYWVVDVQKAQIIAFAIIGNNGSRRIRESAVLPGLSIDILETALSRSRTEDQAQIGGWLLGEFQ
ncbi:MULTISPECIES: Uma2 family endonuclease [Okeania]|uniref:Uma2 family endonuclease n=2 Tax=Okeania TaxID=1458928 RepID=A0A3N6PJC5_9CYAN|nr:MULTISPECIES: Uma2 family endonuclease [Okeania]NET13177.1 Uma2 family endonuclease [Okeania sp. SIO1H6]NES77102.1 Uma2 family endonuclease [Okeania sp. SIO1H4]NES91874.1 Uma2 family endonuclease [Okeania sp. SIO2B9]NET21419.1 Uma2 family endonuclease [Okeania sp. SIO1H5]NET77247.1 Uma2 family endonuclease [Okeania sp. SIO1F9]